MTERKPAGMSFRSWIDQQIEDAAGRGLFDDLPGAGKPLPKRDEDAAQAWLREYLRREGLSTQDVLPTPLKLRKEREVLAKMAPALPSEADVRNAVADLNGRITEWRRFPLDSPIFVPLVDEDQMVSLWRDAHPEPDPGLPSGSDARPRDPTGSRRPRPWWRRRSRNSRTRNRRARNS
jgi:DnaJ homologue, subfamily C, member 28, conserved domain